MLGFTGELKGYVKAELSAVFLAMLDEYCEGKILDHVWKIGHSQTDKESVASMQQKIAIAARELGREQEGRLVKRSSTTKGGASRSSPILLRCPEEEVMRPRWSEQLAWKSIQMELDDSDSHDDKDMDAGGLPPPVEVGKIKGLGANTMDCSQSLSSNLKSVQAVLAQVHKLASGSCPSKDLVLVGLQDETAQACAMVQDCALDWR